MTELWLKYTDEKGEAKRVLVKGEKFVLGRHSENDLSVADSSLSRRHAQIERFGDVFVLSDLKSSNGTVFNGEKLSEPVGLKNGDKFNLGGGFEFKVEMISDDEFAAAGGGGGAGGSTGAGAARNDSEEQAGIASEISAQDALSGSGGSAATAAGGNSFSWGLFILAPLFGVFILLFIGGGILLIAGRGGGSTQTGSTRDSNFIYSNAPPSSSPITRPTDSPTGIGDKTPSPTPTASPTAGSTTSAPSNSDSGGIVENTPTAAPASPQNTGELDKIERGALAFARRIAVNDRNYFLTRPQIGEINRRLKNFKGSDALRENLKAVRQNAAQFEQLAQSKGLKPQFLAAAALARLGNQRGNPLQTAQAMLPVLGELKITLGNELADDNLLIIAAFEQGERGEFRAMRNTVEVLSKQPGVDVTRARTIWYLREKGKLSDAQYEFALRFLAVGIISQNPKDFNVETDAVVFS
jgi:hypothetical protein